MKKQRRLNIIIILSLCLFANGKSQETAPTVASDSITYGYYYCFALYGNNPIYYTAIFKEQQYNEALKPFIEISWQDYIGKTMNLPNYIALAAGPFLNSDYAMQDRQAWLGNFPDSISKQEVQFTYKLNP
jgi:hypothetical protein